MESQILDPLYLSSIYIFFTLFLLSLPISLPSLIRFTLHLISFFLPSLSPIPLQLPSLSVPKTLFFLPSHPLHPLFLPSLSIFHSSLFLFPLYLSSLTFFLPSISIFHIPLYVFHLYPYSPSIAHPSLSSFSLNFPFPSLSQVALHPMFDNTFLSIFPIFPPYLTYLCLPLCN